MTRLVVVVVGVWLMACGDDGAAPDGPIPSDAGMPDASDASSPDAPASTVTAPPLDPDLPTAFFDATRFLYTGDNPLQTGVTPGAIDPLRVVVLRGQVTTRDGAGLPGVTITILDHPELGQTLTRSDGRFDLAANGGGLVSVHYRSAAHLVAQRQVRTPVLEYVHLPDVVMVSRDTVMTSVTMGAPTMQVARGSMQTDGDGSRRATVLFPAGTTGALVQPDGSTVAAPALSIRLTEYTVGQNGPQAMPGSLPATSAYTYAVELGVDEAVAKVDGRDVVFNQPVFLYVENFLNIPVGEVVPVGYYDPAKSAWVGSPNGLVIKLLTATGDLDVTGDDVADTGSVLTALGITDPERARLAVLYSVGQTLWRTPMDHFSTYDCNWGVVCTGGCTPPKEPPPPPTSPCQSNRSGSIIGCERQTLGERVALAGSPLSLHYQSDRVAGRTAEASLALSLGSAGVPMGVQGTEVEVLVAGQKLTQLVSPTTLDTRVSWNGKDAYGREVVGSQSFTVRVGYRYKVVYARGIAVRISWAGLSGIPMTGSPARMELTLFQEWHGTIKRWHNGAQGLGGWSVSDVHAYDPIGRVLHLGDGTQRDLQPLGASTIDTIAGSQAGVTGDGGPAVDARIGNINGLAFGPDGSLYLADSSAGSLRIRRIAPDGIITTIAGTTFGNSGDGGLATQAQFKQVTDVAVGPDGSVYIADAGSYLVRRVMPNGIITTFAGTGVITFGGDGGLATSAGMEPYGLAVGPDGSVYIADRANSRIRVVDQNGIINTLAGTPSSGFTGDGGPANVARISGPTGVALGPDGSVFIMDRTNARVRKVSAQGIITTVAGTGLYGAAGDGGPATAAQLAGPTRLAVAPDGTLYIADSGNNRIRAVGSEGIISTVAGRGPYGFAGDGGLAPGALLYGPTAAAITPDGTIYVADFYNFRIRRLRSALPGGSASEILVPSSDGSEVHVFSGAGRHLRTLDALTGAVRVALTYGPGGLLSIDDGDGNLTTVERDATTGLPTAIVAPHGFRTVLRVASGYLSSIEDPSGAATTLATGPTGLLTSLTDRRGGIHRFAYDPAGRLVRDEDPAGGVQVVTREETLSGATVTVTTGLGRVSSYQLERLASGAQRWIATDPSGAATESVRGADGSITLTTPDGTVEVLVAGPDPRFGMLAPVITSSTRTTPGGLARVETRARTATFSTPGNPLAIATLTETESVDGRTTTRGYDSATRTLTVTSAAGRGYTTTLDLRGRIASERVAGQELFTYGYDSAGRLTSVTAGAGATLRTGSFAYGVNGLLASRTDTLGHSTSFEYDTLGRLTQIVSPDGAATTRTTAFGYDAGGNLVSLTPPGHAAHAFTYDAIDLGASYTPPTVGGASPTTKTHNADRQLGRVTLADATIVDVGYDTSGRTSSRTLPRGVIGYAHDAADRVQTITAPGSLVAGYGYDGALLSSSSVAGTIAGSVTRTYDTAHRLSTLSVNGAGVVSLAYDSDDLLVTVGALTMTRSAQHGRLTGSTLGVVTDAHTYNGYGEPLTYSASVSGTPRLQETYVRDAAGRITQRTETIEGVTTVYAYTYDRAGRLTGVDVNGAAFETYTYDANGNRLSASVGGASRSATYDVQDRVATDGTTSFSHTASGFLATTTTVAGATTYAYDQLGNLLGVTLPGNITITYLIDGQNNRIGKRVGGTLVQGFLYESSLRAIAELDGAGAVVSRFVYGTRDNVPEYLVKAGVTYRILVDHLGSPRLVVNTASGVIAQRLDYDTFGNVTADSNPGFQPFGYAGGLLDRDTKLVRFGARDYDAQVGRWTAKDPLLFGAGEANVYAYAFNDPVNQRDPSGLDPAVPPSDGLLPKDPPKNWLPLPPPPFAPKEKSAPSCTPPTLGESITRAVRSVTQASWDQRHRMAREAGADAAWKFANKQDKTPPSPFQEKINAFEKARPEFKSSGPPSIGGTW